MATIEDILNKKADEELRLEISKIFQTKDLDHLLTIENYAAIHGLENEIFNSLIDDYRLKFYKAFVERVFREMKG